MTDGEAILTVLQNRRDRFVLVAAREPSCVLLMPRDWRGVLTVPEAPLSALTGRYDRASTGWNLLGLRVVLDPLMFPRDSIDLRGVLDEVETLRKSRPNTFEEALDDL